MTIETILFSLWIIASTIGFWFYFKDLFYGKTKPHIFTWFLWALMWYIGFGIQITNNWWLGSYIMLYFSIMPTIVFLYALRSGSRNIAKIDYLFLLLAIIAILFWLILDLAYVSIILLLSIDSMAYLPTFRKSYMKPYEETVILYVLVNIWYIASIVTFDSLVFENYWYPAGLIIVNFIFVSFILIRRKQLSN